MPTATPLYGAATTMTMTLASLASDANLLIGRESTAVSNVTDDAIDALVGGKVTTGTTPTTGKQIEIWAYGSYDGTSYTASATGTDAGLTLTAPRKSLLRLLQIIPTDATSNVTHAWGPFSIAQAFGGFMPRNWGLWIVHNTGVVLNATAGNHEVKYIPLKFESA